MLDLQSGFLQDPWASARLRGGSLGRPPGGNRALAGQRTPRTKATPQKRKPQKAKGKVYPPRGGEDGRGFRTLGLGYSLSYRGSAYAGCLTLSSMSSMATAIRMGTMRCCAGNAGQKPRPRKGSAARPQGKVYLPTGGGGPQRVCTLGFRVLPS